MAQIFHPSTAEGPPSPLNLLFVVALCGLDLMKIGERKRYVCFRL